MTVAQAVQPKRESSKQSYGEVIRSSAKIGGSSAANILLGIIRVKFVSVLIGPAGVGLMGAYGSATWLIGTAAGMGIGMSGVRSMAEAVGAQDSIRATRILATIRWLMLVFGVLGAAVMFLASPLLSRWTFGNAEHTTPLRILSVTILLVSVSSGQTAVLQGLRRISDLVRVNIVGAALGTAIAIPLVCLLRERAVVPLLVAVPVGSIVVSWWFARRVPLERVAMGWREMWTEGKPLLRFGFAMMASGLAAMVVNYLLRVLIIRQLGIDAAGQYQSATNIASMYVGFILGAMGTDFCPRLTGESADHKAMTRMVNEQAEVALLLGGPAILGALTMAPLIIRMFYSAAFADAVELLRWQVLGDLLRVVSWPLGFAIIAKGRGKMFLVSELAANAVLLVSTYGAISMWGIRGSAIGYFLLYCFHWPFVLLIVMRLIGFRYSREYLRLLGLMMPVTAAVFAGIIWLPRPWGEIAGAAATLCVGLYCISHLSSLVPDSRPARVWARIVGGITRTAI